MSTAPLADSTLLGCTVLLKGLAYVAVCFLLQISSHTLLVTDPVEYARALEATDEMAEGHIWLYAKVCI